VEWFTQIAGSLAGLPWWAVLIVVILSVGATKGVDGLIKLLRFGFEREQYQDAQQDKEHDALVDTLKERIDKLESTLTTIQDEFRQERLAAANLLAAEQKAHAKCQIETESLKGDIRVMKLQIEVLMRHEKRNTESIEKLEAIDQSLPAPEGQQP
jgi:predicted S18 family serine protease